MTTGLSLGFGRLNYSSKGFIDQKNTVQTPKHEWSMITRQVAEKLLQFNSILDDGEMLRLVKANVDDSLCQSPTLHHWH